MPINFLLLIKSKIPIITSGKTKTLNTWESICISIGLAPKTGTINPVSLHLEYDLGGAEHGDPKITIDKEDVFNQMKKDLTFLRETWKNV